MFTFDITPDGHDQVRVTATSRDIAMWERTTKGRSMALLERELKMTYLEEVAYLAAVRVGAYVGGDLESFRRAVDIVPVDLAAEKAAAEAGDDEEGPTRPAP